MWGRCSKPLQKCGCRIRFSFFTCTNVPSRRRWNAAWKNRCWNSTARPCWPSRVCTFDRPMGWHPFRYRTITIGALPNCTRFYRYTMSMPALEDTTGPPDKVKFDVDPFNLSIDTAQLLQRQGAHTRILRPRLLRVSHQRHGIALGNLQSTGKRVNDVSEQRIAPLTLVQRRFYC